MTVTREETNRAMEQLMAVSSETAACARTLWTSTSDTLQTNAEYVLHSVEAMESTFRDVAGLLASADDNPA